jgi:hypothetical protein
LVRKLKLAEEGRIPSTTHEIPESAYNLGELRADYRVSTVQVLFCILCLAILFVFMGALGLARLPNLLAPQNAVDFAVLAIGFVFFGGALAWGGGQIWKMVRNRQTRVLIFDEGFVSFRRDRVFVCRWDEIEWTRDELVPHGDAFIHQCTVRTRGGDEWSVNNMNELVDDFPGMVHTITTEAAKRLAPQALADLQAARTLDFGALQLTPQGIVHGGNLLLWEDVGAIGSDSFRVTVEKRGAWLTWAAVSNTQLANRDLFLELARQFKEVAAQELVAAGR